jgi:hypothetical protein
MRVVPPDRAAGSLAPSGRAEAVGPQVLPDSIAGEILARPTTALLFEEGFEYGWLPDDVWNVADKNAGSGYDYWDAVTAGGSHVAYAGLKSAYCAGYTDRTDGRYDHDMRAEMATRAPIYSDGGPLVVTFHYWCQSQDGADFLSLDTSCDGSSWVSVTSISGSSGGWRTDQTVITGCPRLWLRFVFESDGSVEAQGAYVDEIRVDGASPGPADLLWATPPGWAGPLVLSRYPGTHHDEVPDAERPTYFDLAVANVGGSDSPPCRTRVDVDGDPAFYVDVPALAPGALAAAEDVVHVVPTAGGHVISAWADAGYLVFENDELNNLHERVVVFAPPSRADLRFSAASVSPALALSGEAVTVSVTLENAGQVYAPVTQLGFYWNRTWPPAPREAPDTTVLVTDFLVGERRAFQFTRAFAGSASWSAYAQADVFDFETESNEGNNVAGPFPCLWRALALTARDLGTGSDVGLHWTRVPGASYQLEGAAPGEPLFHALATTSDTVWRHAALQENETRRYRVRVLRDGAAPALSPEASATPRLPLVLVHGLGLSPLLPGDARADTAEYWRAWRSLLDDAAQPATRFEHLWMPALPRQGSIERCAAELAAYLDTRLAALGRRNRQEFGFDLAPARVQAVGHSAGGLHLRSLMHRRHGLVARAVLVATPNGGSPLASALAVAMHQTVTVLSDPDHGCVGRPLICQLAPPYMNLVFNLRVRRDPTPGVRVEGVAGSGGTAYNLLFLGQANDGVVTVRSVYHPAVFPPDYARHVLPLLHAPLKSDATVLEQHVYPLLAGEAWGASPPWPFAPAPALASEADPEEAGDWRLVDAVADSGGAGEWRILPFALAGGARARVTATSLDGAELDLALLDPGGAKWDSSRAAARDGCDFLRLAEPSVLAGESLVLESPAPGAWRAVVTVRSPVPRPSAFVVAVEESSRVALSLETAAPVASVGEAIWVRARLDSAGVPLAADVSAEVRGAEGTAIAGSLDDDGAHGDGAAGDGLYAGPLTAPAVVGDYSLLVAATRPGGGGTRRTAGVLTVGSVDAVPPAVHVVTPSAAGDVLFAGAPNPIRWTASDSAGVDSVALWFSLEDGSAHVPIATRLPASGEHVWHVPETLCGRLGRVRALAFDPSLNVGEDQSDAVIGVVVVVGAPGPSRPDFGLRVLGTLPARAAVTFEAALPERARAVLEVYDVGGRRVRRLLAGRLEAGTHRVTWNLDDEGRVPVPAGIYWVRWRAGRRTASQTVVVLR